MMPSRRRQPGLLPALLVGLVVVGAGCDLDSPDAPPDVPRDGPEVPSLHPDVDDLPAAVVHLVGPDGETVRVDVRIAATREAQRRGLMEVPDLPDGAGMLFTYTEGRRGGFWMKDTLVPLDIAFFDEGDVLREILAMEPCVEDPCPVYDPGIRYTNALEVPAGWLDERGVERGWTLEVTHRRSSSPGPDAGPMDRWGYPAPSTVGRGLP